MRLTTRTNYAMRALMYCAVNEGRIVRRADIAEACNASENHLAQIINSLSQFGFLDTVRGRNGGVRLARAPEEINVGDVIRQMEHNVPFTECFAGDENTCPISDCCRLREALSAALEAFYTSLSRITLSDLVEDNANLNAILAYSRNAGSVQCERMIPAE